MEGTMTQDGMDTLAVVERRLGDAAGPDVVLIRNGSAAAATYMAVNAGYSGAFTGVPGAELLPWDVLPGVRPWAAAQLAEGPLRTALILGTAVDGEWASWVGPEPTPPVPAN